MNSGSSSRSSTPRCARLTSPGRAGRPPPTIAAIDALWCGARNGGSRTSGCSGREQPGDGVDARHLERLVRLERRQEPRQAAGEHRLARARRAGEQQVVAAGGRELERPPGALLAADVGEVRGTAALVPSLAAARTAAAPHSPRRYAAASARCRTGTGSMPASAASAADSAAQSSRSTPGPPRRLGGGEHAADRPDAPVERELADRGVRRPGAPAAPAARRRAPRARSAGRSPSPPCGAPAGARLTVIRRTATRARPTAMPLRTRCFASWQARSARPTIVKPGRRSSTCASTSTRRASRPTSAWVSVRASTPPRAERTRSAVTLDARAWRETSSKNSPARRPVRRFTWRTEAVLEAEPGALEDLRVELAAVVDDDRDRRARAQRACRTFGSTSTIPSA